MCVARGDGGGCLRRVFSSVPGSDSASPVGPAGTCPWCPQPTHHPRRPVAPCSSPNRVLARQGLVWLWPGISSAPVGEQGARGTGYYFIFPRSQDLLH